MIIFLSIQSTWINSWRKLNLKFKKLINSKDVTTDSIENCVSWKLLYRYSLRLAIGVLFGYGTGFKKCKEKWVE